MTSTDERHPITLTAILTGPYPSVAALKAGVSHSKNLVATPIRVTDRTSGVAISTIGLPLDLMAGWYDIDTSIQSPEGSTGGATVIEVTPLGS